MSETQTFAAFTRLLAVDAELDRCRISPDGWCFTHSTDDGPVYCDEATP